MVSAAEIRIALDQVADPELPVSIVELGMVQNVACDDGCARVTLLPTYTGCPALPMIEADVRDKVGAVPGVQSVEVAWCYEPAWTPDLVSPEGRTKLRDHGVTTPCCGQQPTVTLTTSAIPCPYCGSQKTRLDSPFGPTRCRSIHFCEACRNQFEHMKPRS